jgi:hypothetical protein
MAETAGTLPVLERVEKIAFSAKNREPSLKTTVIASQRGGGRPAWPLNRRFLLLSSKTTPPSRFGAHLWLGGMQRLE